VLAYLSAKWIGSTTSHNSLPSHQHAPPWYYVTHRRGLTDIDGIAPRYVAIYHPPAWHGHAAAARQARDQ